jgi:hypothetical protein
MIIKNPANAVVLNGLNLGWFCLKEIMTGILPTTSMIAKSVKVIVRISLSLIELKGGISVLFTNIYRIIPRRISNYSHFCGKQKHENESDHRFFPLSE